VLTVVRCEDRTGLLLVARGALCLFVAAADTGEIKRFLVPRSDVALLADLPTLDVVAGRLRIGLSKLSTPTSMTNCGWRSEPNGALYGGNSPIWLDSFCLKSVKWVAFLSAKVLGEPRTTD